MNVADIIRKHVSASEKAGLLVNPNIRRSDCDDEWQMPAVFTNTPGLLPGILSSTLSLLAFVPVRRIFLGAIGKSWGELPNIFITASQLVLSADVGLLTCSIVGSRHYLHQLASVSTTTSPTADAICNHELVNQLAKHEPLPIPESNILPAAYDPRVVLAQDLQRALDTCRQRQRRSGEDWTADGAIR